MVDKTVVGTVRRYLREIPSELGMKKAFIFGSHAKGTQHSESDIDIAVVLAHMTDFFQVQAQLMRLRRDIDLRIEPHPISEEDFNPMNPLAKEIAETGFEVTA